MSNRAVMATAWMASLLVLTPASALANDGLGALGEAVWAFGVAGLVGCGPTVMLFVSLFLFKWVRARSPTFRRGWPWAVLSLALAGHLALAGFTIWATRGTKRSEATGEMAAGLCSLVLLVLSIVAVLAAFRAARQPTPRPTPSAAPTPEGS